MARRLVRLTTPPGCRQVGPDRASLALTFREGQRHRGQTDGVVVHEDGPTGHALRGRRQRWHGFWLGRDRRLGEAGLQQRYAVGVGRQLFVGHDRGWDVGVEQFADDTVLVGPTTSGRDHEQLLSDVTTGEIEVALQGASSLALTGTGGNADVSAKGARKADLGGFTVANAKVKLEGASDATITTDGVLDVDLAGSSDVRYLGEPTLGDVKMRGDSSLERGN